MAQIFPKWANEIPKFVIAGVLTTAVAVTFGFWYFGSPKYLEVGYRPKQPVPYSHKLHAGDLGMDCRYCHIGVEKSAHASLPATSTCMNCHTQVAAKSEKLLPVRESYATNKPIQWVKVHKVPDFAYFNHSTHVNAGVGCKSCHGNVAQMDERGVMQVEPLSMGWCLDCHRNPEPHLRPKSEITNMDWVMPANQKEFAAKLIAEKKINPPVDCGACHR